MITYDISLAFLECFKHKNCQMHNLGFVDTMTCDGLIGGGVILSTPEHSRQGPYKWRHARLAPIKADLCKRVEAGSYRPLLREGLYD